MQLFVHWLELWHIANEHIGLLYPMGVGQIFTELFPVHLKTSFLHAPEHDHATKGNVDADLVLWAMKEMPKYRKAVIVSGDGDFYALVEYLAGKNRLAKLLTPNEHYSGLYNKYDKFVDRLDTKRKHLAYHDRPKTRGKK